MTKATLRNKQTVVDILVESFNDNKSVVSTTGGKEKRMHALMAYAFKTCLAQGFVYLSADRKACALILLPDKKTTTLKSIWNDVLFCIKGLYLFNILKVLKREKLISKKQPGNHIYHLWFIAVARKHQNNGAVSSLPQKVLADASLKNRPLVLETSDLKNISWYNKFGLSVYDQLSLGYDLYFLKSAS